MTDDLMELKINWLTDPPHLVVGDCMEEIMTNMMPFPTRCSYCDDELQAKDVSAARKGVTGMVVVCDDFGCQWLYFSDIMIYKEE